MKYSIFLFLFFILCKVNGQPGRKISLYPMEDSLKATAVYAETLLTLRVKKSFQNIKAGISADKVSISLLKHGDKRFVLFSAPFKAKNSVHPQDVFNHNSIFFCKYNCNNSLYYQLLIMSAHNSAGKNTMYAGYIHLLRENKWKLIASVSVKNAPKFIGKIDIVETYIIFLIY